MMSTRLRVDEPFGKPMKLGGDINSRFGTTARPCHRWADIDLLIGSQEVSGSLDLWKASRSTVDVSSTISRKLEGALTRTGQESGAYLSADGKVLIFESRDTMVWEKRTCITVLAKVRIGRFAGRFRLAR